ncbi:MAG: glucose 1-dehydrogenase [Pseudomonadota bacterium]
MSRDAASIQDFAGKVALVTGGATGIGEAAAALFAVRGATVVIAGRRRDVGEAAAAKIVAAGGRAEFAEVDVAKPDEVAALHDGIEARHGGLDVAFDNAGYREPRGPLAEQPLDQYDQVFDTNVRGVVCCLQRQVAAMRRRGGGAIVVNASVSGLRNPNPGFALYSASKAAVISLVRAAAMEHAAEGIRINALAPGRVATEMVLSSAHASPEEIAAGLPIRRMGTPEEAAEAAVWLASDAASYVVGHVLCADGGFMAS